MNYAITYEDTIFSMHENLEDAIEEIKVMLKDGSYNETHKLYEFREIPLSIEVNVNVSLLNSVKDDSDK